MASKRSKNNDEQRHAKISAEQPGQESLHVAKLSQPNIAEGFATIAMQNDSHHNCHSASLSPRPVGSSSLESSSAALPAPTYDGLPQHLTLQECKNWLQALPSQEVLQIKPLQRLQAAITVLQRRDSRQQRQEVQRLLHPWGVLQKIQGRKRKYNEGEKGFHCKSCERRFA